MGSILCRLGFHKWLPWGEPVRRKVYARMVGLGDVTLETKWSAFGHLIFDGMTRERKCERCDQSQMERI
jgi:hypothetical protein